MPFGDGTGPNGLGPFTGRGRGFCAGIAVDTASLGLGRGRFLRLGRRGGRGNNRNIGFGRNTYNPLFPVEQEFTPEQELTLLKNQAQNFNLSLENIRQRISELEEITSHKQ